MSRGTAIVHLKDIAKLDDACKRRVNLCMLLAEVGYIKLVSMKSRRCNQLNLGGPSNRQVAPVPNS